MITSFVDGVISYFNLFLEFAIYIAGQIGYQLSSPTDEILWLILVFIFFMFFSVVTFLVCRFFFNLIWRIICL